MFGFNNNSRIEPHSLERIEVLHGPASVLYGQGSTAGVVNMVSKRPLDGAGNEIGLSVGNYSRLQTQGDLNGRLGDDGSLLCRVVFVARNSDTQVDYVPDGAAMLAPSITWRPDANTNWTLLSRFQRNDAGSSATFLPWSGTILPNPNGKIPTHRFIGEPGYDKYDTESYSVTSLFEHRFDNQWVLRQSTRWTYSDGDYQTLYPFSNFIDKYNPYVNQEQREIIRAIYANKRKTHNLLADQNLQGTVMTGGVAHQLLFGLDYTNYRETAPRTSRTATRRPSRR
jgi:iron complex outermembrane recepter protein